MPLASLAVAVMVILTSHLECLLLGEVKFTVGGVVSAAVVKLYMFDQVPYQ